MRRQATGRRPMAVFVAVLALVGALGGVAFAIPDGSGAIHACYSNSDGAVRLVDKQPTDCTAGETGIQWNQTGAPGSPGSAGPGGPPGAPGSPGAPGAPGTTAAVGNFGLQQHVSLALPSDGSDVTVFRKPAGRRGKRLRDEPITLPAGAYSIQARTWFGQVLNDTRDDPQRSSSVSCELRMTDGKGTQLLDYDSVRWGHLHFGGQRRSVGELSDLRLMALVNVSDPSGDLRFVCRRDPRQPNVRNPDSITLQRARIVIVHLSTASTILAE